MRINLYVKSQSQFEDIADLINSSISSRLKDMKANEPLMLEIAGRLCANVHPSELRKHGIKAIQSRIAGWLSAGVVAQAFGSLTRDDVDLAQPVAIGSRRDVQKTSSASNLLELILCLSGDSLTYEFEKDAEKFAASFTSKYTSILNTIQKRSNSFRSVSRIAPAVYETEEKAYVCHVASLVADRYLKTLINSSSSAIRDELSELVTLASRSEPVGYAARRWTAVLLEPSATVERKGGNLVLSSGKRSSDIQFMMIPGSLSSASPIALNSRVLRIARDELESSSVYHTFSPSEQANKEKSVEEDECEVTLAIEFDSVAKFPTGFPRVSSYFKDVAHSFIKALLGVPGTRSLAKLMSASSSAASIAGNAAAFAILQPKLGSLRNSYLAAVSPGKEVAILRGQRSSRIFDFGYLPTLSKKLGVIKDDEKEAKDKLFSISLKFDGDSYVGVTCQGKFPETFIQGEDEGSPLSGLEFVGANPIEQDLQESNSSLFQPNFWTLSFEY